MPSTLPLKRFFVIDAMAMAFRSFYAFGLGKPLTTAAGQPTAAVFGCAMFMNKLLTEQKPDYLVIACDTKSPTFRHALYDGYKANRTAMPEDLAAQMPLLMRLFEAYGCPVLKIEGYEADDIIGTLAQRFASPEVAVYIVSGDKDFCQLVNDHVFLYQPKKGDDALVVDTNGVISKFGVQPNQIIDCLALIGDASDNVPGVRGIGEKGAAKLIADFGSLDGIYAALERITNPKQRTALATHREMAYLSRDLVTIRTDVPLDLTLDQLNCDAAGASTSEQLLHLFRELEFRTLAAKIEVNLLPPAAKALAKTAPMATSEKASGRRRISADTPNYVLVDSKAKLAQLQTALTHAACFAFDTETTGLDLISDQPIGFSFAISAASQSGGAEKPVGEAGAAIDKGHQAFYLPLVAKHLTGGDLSPAEAIDGVRAMMADPSKTKVGHNLKFDLQMLSHTEFGNIELAGPLVDTMICSWLLDPAGRQHGLDSCCLKHLNYEKIPTSTLIGNKGDISMLDAPIADLTRYACEDADLTLQLMQALLPQIEAKGLNRVLHDIEMPLIPVLARMEQNGVFIDAATLGAFSTRLGAMAQNLEAEIYKLAGTEFNINSPRQLADILFNQLKIHEQLGIRNLKKTQSGYSTDESVLTRLTAHPLASAILDYRSISKLKNTYVDTLPKLRHSKTGRVHTSFHQTGTATGRLSSSEPNLQNIPIRTELGQEIRRAFRAPSDETIILSVDYSQIELRLLAHLADEKALAQAFSSGQDIHRLTASKIFGVASEDVDAIMRSRAKAINFGIIYGMGPRRLAAETGVSMAEATEFIDRYFASYPGISVFVDQAVQEARDAGETRTLSGRLRPVEGLQGGAGRRDVVSAENIAVNTKVQGSAADLIKLAMIAIDRKLIEHNFKTKMLLQVHDELVFECPVGELSAIKHLVADCMRHAMTLSVPLDVEVGAGTNWLEAH